MALKGDRHVVVDDISFFLNEVATRGGVVSFSTVGSGVALDQSAALATYASASSGSVPIGLLLNDMVNIDATRQHINWHKDEMMLGQKVTIMKKGFGVTNSILGTPAKGDKAVLTSSGVIAAVSNANWPTHNKVNMPFVGLWHSAPDEDGFAKLYVDL